jgi:hypothetical protein
MPRAFLESARFTSGSTDALVPRARVRVTPSYIWYIAAAVFQEVSRAPGENADDAASPAPEKGMPGTTELKTFIEGRSLSAPRCSPWR